MSNSLAIATVSACLQRILQRAIDRDVPGALVNMGFPHEMDSHQTEAETIISLYQVESNPAYRNADLPGRDFQGNLLANPQVGLDLYYLISFQGDEQTMLPQRLLGSTLRMLHSTPLLTREFIDDTVKQSAVDTLVNSNLSGQIAQVSWVLQKYDLEQLVQIWSIFSQTPYLLSVVYRASVVLISDEQVIQRAPRVSEPRIGSSILNSGITNE